jgi:hypothetical protein
LRPPLETTRRRVARESIRCPHVQWTRLNLSQRLRHMIHVLYLQCFRSVGTLPADAAAQAAGPPEACAAGDCFGASSHLKKAPSQLPLTRNAPKQAAVIALSASSWSSRFDIYSRGPCPSLPVCIAKKRRKQATFFFRDPKRAKHQSFHMLCLLCRLAFKFLARSFSLFCVFSS